MQTSGAGGGLAERLARCVVLAAMLGFTLPAHEGNGCLEAIAPLTDLDSLYVWRQDVGPPRVVFRQGVRGCEGWAWGVPVTLPGVYYVTTRDRAGNESCASGLVQVGGALDVPGGTPVVMPAPDRWYDVAGRRVREPLPQGVYLSRGKRRVVVR